MQAEADAVAALIERSYGPAEAAAYRVFSPDSKMMEAVAAIGREVLEIVPPRAGDCAAMSAFWTVGVRERIGAPIHAIAGDLMLRGGVPVFQSDLSTEQFPSLLQSSNLDWPGHCWVTFGAYLGDASLFRTAYRRPPGSRLRAAVLEHFGEGRGLLVAKAASLDDLGFCYVPKYVLRDEEITAIMNGAAERVFGSIA